MPRFSPGRLFWKFLFFFFLAQMTTVIGTGLAIWATRPDNEQWPPPPPRFEERQAPAGNEASVPMTPPPPVPRLPIIQLLAGAVVSLVFAALLAAYVSRPILRLRLALQAGAQGQLIPGLSAAMGRRRDELADLGHDFDRMARHLKQLMEGQRRLLHDVSHELRSPLARLNALIGLVRQQPDSLDECLSRLEHESVRMDRLLSQLLTLSRLESGMVERVNERINLSELLDDVVADATPEVDQAGFLVEFVAETNTVVNGDPEMLHRVFDNLLRNALTHAAAGKWVGITIVPGADTVGVRVDDRGSGVFSADVERLFMPFFRGAHTSGRNGHGLGLAIARQIVENHHGRIEAANRPEGGLRLTVTLPLAAKASG